VQCWDVMGRLGHKYTFQSQPLETPLEIVDCGQRIYLHTNLGIYSAKANTPVLTPWANDILKGEPVDLFSISKARDFFIVGYSSGPVLSISTDGTSSRQIFNGNIQFDLVVKDENEDRLYFASGGVVRVMEVKRDRAWVVRSLRLPAGSHLQGIWDTTLILALPNHGGLLLVSSTASSPPIPIPCPPLNPLCQVYIHRGKYPILPAESPLIIVQGSGGMKLVPLGMVSVIKYDTMPSPPSIPSLLSSLLSFPSLHLLFSLHPSILSLYLHHNDYTGFEKSLKILQKYIARDRLIDLIPENLPALRQKYICAKEERIKKGN